MFWLILALSSSVIANIFIFYYIRVLLGRLYYISENMGDLTDLVTNYRNHLKNVYGMEMFYGDETLQFLIRHTKSLCELLEDFEDAYSIIDPIEIVEEDTQQEEKETNAEEKISDENVFYAGTRRSNN